MTDTPPKLSGQFRLVLAFGTNPRIAFEEPPQ